MTKEEIEKHHELIKKTFGVDDDSEITEDCEGSIEGKELEDFLNNKGV